MQQPYNGRRGNQEYPMNTENYPQGYNQPYTSGYGDEYNQHQYYHQGPHGRSPPAFHSQQQMSAYQGYNQGYGRGGSYHSPRGGYSRGISLANRGRLIRKKKPFVGGSLESQREWESQTACCFFLQGQCRFGERCRFVHDMNRTDLQCQFGEKCQKGHGYSHGSDQGENATPQYSQGNIQKQSN